MSFSSNCFYALISRTVASTLVVFAILTTVNPLSGSVIYVDADTIGSDGSSWSNAYSDLKTALGVAISGDQIWVSEGVYKPTTNMTATTVRFVILDGVSVYGGFSGTEVSVEAADPENNVTVLSGDINSDDTVDANGVTLSYTDIGTGNTKSGLVYVVSASTGVTLSGLTICGGEAIDDRGAGLKITGVGNVSVERCVIRGNSSKTMGGGISTDSEAVLVIEDSKILENYTAVRGGGFSVRNSTITFVRCVLSANVAKFSGGGGFIGTNSSASLIEGVCSLIDCLVSGNRAGDDGGALYSTINSIGSFNLINTTISGNAAVNDGGGIYLGNSISLVAVNSIVWGNSDDLLQSGAVATFWSHCIVAGSGGSDAWDATNYGADAGGNLDTNPFFTIDLSSASAPSLAGDFRLQNTSPAVAVADEDAYDFVNYPTDLDGASRLQNSALDLGAYEANLGPSVTSSSFTTVDPMDATSLELTLSFDEEVMNFDNTDLSIVSTGSASYLDATVTGLGVDYTITLNTTSGEGAFFVTVEPSDITDLNGNALFAAATLEQLALVSSGGTSLVHYVNSNSATPEAPYTTWETAAVDLQDAFFLPAVVIRFGLQRGRIWRIEGCIRRVVTALRVSCWNLALLYTVASIAVRVRYRSRILL